MKRTIVFFTIIWLMSIALLAQDTATLLQAIQANDLPKVKALVTAGADVNARDEHNATALMWAAYKADLEMAQYLVSQGTDYTQKGVIYLNKEKTAYYGNLTGIAAGEGKLELLQYLIEGLGINVNDKEYNLEDDKDTGMTAIEWADSKERNNITQYLITKGADTTAIQLNRLNEEMISLYQLGKYEEAIFFGEKLLQLAENHLGKDHPDYGTSLNNLALLYESMGRYADAEPLYQEALQNSEASLGKDHPDYGTHLNNLAALYESMGRYADAEPLQKEALQNAEASLGKDHPDYGTHLNNLALLYEAMGRYADAEPLYQEALQNTEASLGKDHPDYGTRLNNLALLYKAMGRYADAEPLYQEALQNAEASLGKDHRNYGRSLNNLAGLFRSMGRYSEAEPLLKVGLQNAEASLGKDHPEYGRNLHNLAALYESMGRYADAEPLYQEALQNVEASLGKDHPEYGKYLNNLALLYEAMGRYSEAGPLLQQANEVIYHNLNQSFIGLSEKEKKQYLKTVDDYFEVYHSFALRGKSDNPFITILSYNNTLINKGLLLQSSVDMRQSILESGDSSLLLSYDTWIGLKNWLSKLYSLPIKERYVSTDSLENLANDLEKQLNREASAFWEQTQALQVKWEDVKKNLGENEAAIEFISFRYRNDTAWTDSTLYTALIVRPEDKYPHMIDLFEEKQLQQLLEKSISSDEGFISELYATRGAVVANAPQTFKGDSLYQLIWQPLDSLLKDVKTVYFSPTGLLHQIAFAALPYQEGLLSEHFNLHQLSSTRVLALPSSADSITTAVVYGGIDYDTTPSVLENHATQSTNFITNLLAESSRGENRGTSWQFLSGTATEAEKVHNLLAENHIITPPYSLQAEEAQEETFKALGKNRSPSLIHVATHGFFFPDVEKKQSEEIELLRGEDTYRLAEDPLLRSGLLFTGANHAWMGETLPEGLEDGILTAYEVAQLNLSNTELVVLSACETGLGEVQGSEGVYGLQRAFKMAGVKYLIMSLWKVPDAQTVELMEKFYSYWLGERQPIRTAFRQAQQEMQEKYDPFYWAAFVLVE